MSHVILGVCGSIAAYKAATIASRLTGAEVQVTCVLTRHAQEFIGATTFWGLTRRSVVTEDFSPSNPGELERVNLADSADLLLIAPATASMIGKLACGLADDYLSTLALTVRCPIWLAPAMNDAMWEAAIVQENLARLQARGCRVLAPEEGRLACGHTGPGRLADPDWIAQEVLQHLGG